MQTGNANTNVWIGIGHFPEINKITLLEFISSILVGISKNIKTPTSGDNFTFVFVV